MEAKCNRCSRKLDEIKFVEPNWNGQSLDYILCQRPPLCESCWEKADREWSRKQHKGAKKKASPTSTHQTLDKISELIQEYADCPEELDSFKVAGLVYQTVLNDLRDILSEGGAEFVCGNKTKNIG